MSTAQLDPEQLSMLKSLRNGEMLGMLIRSYRSQTQQQLAEMAIALNMNDTKCIADIAHSLKSASLTLGATQMGEVSAQLESAAKHNDIPQCAQLADTLQNSFAAVLPELAKEERP